MDYTTFRQGVSDYLTTTLPLVLDPAPPVVPFLPDDVAQLPVVVVGRTGVVVSEGVMATYHLWVDLVGRRLANQDAQDELDANGDGFLAALSMIPPNMHLVSIEPEVVAIANVEYPVHRAIIACDDRLICTLPTRRTA